MQSKIQSLGEIALRVNDLGKMVAFYQEKIGLDLIRREPHFAFFKISDGHRGHTQVLALFDRSQSRANYLPPMAAHTSVDHLAFTINKEDFESEDQRLKAAGLQPTYAYHTWVQWNSLYISDPEGNTVELVCYDPHAGQA